MQPAEQRESVEIIQPQALELIERAQIDMQISTAKKYPRDLAKVKRRMLDFATLDEETAESCFYTLTREGKSIQGPSVRLAEIAVSCYGNLRAASRIVDNDGKTITAQGVCHDLENNTLISVEVKRRITKRDGKTFSDDMQVVAGNAANSIAFRNAVFKVIPGALTKPVYEAAKAVAVGDASKLATRRAKIIQRLNSMQVTTDRILARLGKSSVENVGLEDLELLIGLGTAIKDGDTTVDEAFAIEQGSREQATDIAITKIAKASGFTEDQVRDCINEKDVLGALRKKYGEPGAEKKQPTAEDGGGSNTQKPAASSVSGETDAGHGAGTTREIPPASTHGDDSKPVEVDPELMKGKKRQPNFFSGGSAK